MFECKYKYEIEDSIASAKYIYKSQKRKQDKIIAILIPFLMAAMVAMLVYDIVKGKSFVWDIVLLVALIVLEVLYLIVPIMLVRSQKKLFKKLKLDEMDYILITINETLCVEKMMKNEEELSNNIHNLKQLTSYIEDNERLILVFNNVEYVCLRKNAITGDVLKLKAHLEKIMSKATKRK